MCKLHDTDKMPWGKYAGKLMQDVPASYLHWLWVNEKSPLSQEVKFNMVAEYIYTIT